MPTASIVDAHLHLWDPALLRYPWLQDHPSLQRPFGLSDLDQALGEVELVQAVFVQCECLPEDAGREVDFVREIARRDPRLAGMVAYAALEEGAGARPWLEELAREPLVRGVRRLLQSEPDPEFCLREDFVGGVRSLADFGFTFDLCLLHGQLAAATELVRRVPQVQFVLDHLGKPAIGEGRLDPWRRELRELSRLPNVAAKLSGLVTEADPARWTEDDLRPYVEHAFECFGPRRLLFGGDWPVSTLATTYAHWVAVACGFAADLSQDEQQALFADNARAIYRLGG